MDADTVARGEYVAVEPPRRCVFTWGWEDDDAMPPGSTTVELRLEPDGDGTILQLRHVGIGDAENRDRHDECWRFFVARLDVATAGGDPGPMPARPPES
jgi:uncharacterized protein YndB with AHSA1/START domain